MVTWRQIAGAQSLVRDRLIMNVTIIIEASVT